MEKIVNWKESYWKSTGERVKVTVESPPTGGAMCHIKIYNASGENTTGIGIYGEELSGLKRKIEKEIAQNFGAYQSCRKDIHIERWE